PTVLAVNRHRRPGSAPASFWLPRHPLAVYSAGSSDSFSVRYTDSTPAFVPAHSGIWKLTTPSDCACGPPADTDSEADQIPVSVALLGRQLTLPPPPDPVGPVGPVRPGLPSGPVAPVAP